MEQRRGWAAFSRRISASSYLRLRYQRLRQNESVSPHHREQYENYPAFRIIIHAFLKKCSLREADSGLSQYFPGSRSYGKTAGINKLVKVAAANNCFVLSRKSLVRNETSREALICSINTMRVRVVWASGHVIKTPHFSLHFCFFSVASSLKRLKATMLQPGNLTFTLSWLKRKY